MEKKANLDIAPGVSELLAQKLRQEHQVVVVDPNIVIISNVKGYFFGKQSVDRLIRHCCCGVRYHFVPETVDERPHDLICGNRSVQHEPRETAR
jgi:hypothetical protein